MNIIEIKNLTKNYGKARGIIDVNLILNRVRSLVLSDQTEQENPQP